MNETISSAGDRLEAFLSPLIGGLGEQLPSVLVTLLILFVGIIVARMVRKGTRKLINNTGLQQKLAGSGSDVDVGMSLGSLVYYIVLLMVLLLVLERMGITSVLDPLKNLVDQFVGALPNIIGAGIIFYAGWVVAKLASGFVGLAANQLDQRLEDKGFNEDFKASKFLSAFVFGGVLLPITVAGFQFLNIESISGPAIQMITDFMGAVPNIVAAGLILLVAYFLGKFIVYMLTGLLEGMNIDAVPQKLGVQGFFNEHRSPSGFIGAVVMFFIMLTAATAAVEKLNIELISNIFAQLLEFGGGIVLGAVILIVGNFLANIAYTKLSENAQNASIANIARFAILGLVLAMGLKAMGLADNIVNMAFAFTFGAVAIAVALSFGLGGRDAAGKIANKWADKL